MEKAVRRAEEVFEHRAAEIERDIRRTLGDKLTFLELHAAAERIETDSCKLVEDIDNYLDFTAKLDGVVAERNAWVCALINVARSKLRTCLHASRDQATYQRSRGFTPEITKWADMLNGDLAGMLRWFEYAAPTAEKEVLVYKSDEYERILHEAHFFGGALVEYILARKELGLWAPVIRDFNELIEPGIFSELAVLAELRGLL